MDVKIAAATISRSVQVNLRESWSIGPVEIPTRLVLAPMAGVSVQAFRRQGRRFGARLVGAGAATLTLHPRSAKQMYTGHADHSLTAELVDRVDVPVIASGDITSRAKASAVLATTGAAAVMVGRAAQGNPWALREILDAEPAEPTREEVVAELLIFIRETVRELGEQRATGFLK